MIIKPKYAINDIVQINGQRQDDKNISYMKVQEIHTTSCIAGTQIYYLCRAFFINEELIKGIRHGHAISRHDSGYAVQKLRQDEIEPISTITQAKILEMTGDKYKTKQ